MSYEIAIDTGGTFTDIVASGEDRVVATKVPTTAYDLSRCFFGALDAVAEALGTDRAGLLPQVTKIVYATTVGTNALIQRKGPRVGVIATAGGEDTLSIMRGVGVADYWRTARDASDRGRAPTPLVPRQLVTGVSERVGDDGGVELELTDAEAQRAVQALLDLGVNSIAVCLLNSFRNPVHERLIRDVARRDYPGHLLGAVPIFLSSDVAPYRGEYGRTNATAIDAYLHRPLARFLFPLEEALRRQGYSGRPLLLVGNDGGASRIAKTTAIKTWNSGPVAGVLGGVDVARRLEIDNLVVADMGGTSFDVAIIADGSPPLEEEPVVEGGLRMRLPVVASTAIGSGGGTIARVETGGRLTVGPESAEAVPGPACFGLGGSAPTVTDADVVLGWIDPTTFLGGRMPLSRDAARAALEEHVAGPRGQDVRVAAEEIRRSIQHQMASRVRRALTARRLVPETVTILAYGGACPAHICGIAREAGCRSIVITPLSSVFSASGAALRRVEHVYARDVAPGAALGEVVEDLRRQADKDMRIERATEGQLSFEVRLESPGTGYGAWFPIAGDVPADATAAARERHHAQLAELFGGSPPGDQADAVVVAVRLRVVAAEALPELDSRAFVAAATLPPVADRREVWLDGAVHTVPVRSLSDLSPGEPLEGPAVVELVDSTCVLEPGFSLEVDGEFNCHIKAIGTSRSESEMEVARA